MSDHSSHILTATGRYVDPLDLRVGDVEVADIARSLSNQVRFGGHSWAAYTVAQHSVLVSRLVKKLGGSLEDQKWGLIHDASEAYLVDIPRPIKKDPKFGQTYRGAEKRAMAVLCDFFGLPRAMPQIVHQADMILFSTEFRDMMVPSREVMSQMEEKPMKDGIRPWNHVRAESGFLKLFSKLFGLKPRRAPLHKNDTVHR